MDYSGFQTRAMTSADSAAVLELCKQLGYSPGQNATRASIERIQNDPDHFLRIVISKSGQIVAWIHGCTEIPIEGPPFVCVSSIVVDAAYRGKGIGKRLMTDIEQWARDKGFFRVNLRSQTYREEAHRFYKRIGYRVTKTSFQIERKLD